MKKTVILSSLILVLVIAATVFAGVMRSHTFTFDAVDGTAIRSEEIQPLFGTVRVSGDQDTSVVFTDVETGEKYTIGYITNGVTEKIKLQPGRWYTVEGAGRLVVGPVNVRTE